MFSPWGVVVAGGSGTRYGRLKQLDDLAGKRVLDWSVSALRPVCDGIVVVVPPTLVAELEIHGVNEIVSGGDTRSDSVRRGLSVLPSSATHVLIHDAARPLASSSLVARVVQALVDGAQGVVPVVAINDSMRAVDGGSVDRNEFVAVQTPQGFDLSVLLSAHQSARVATDDASLLDRIGADVVHVAGEATNLKITEPHDLQLAEVLLHGC